MITIFEGARNSGKTFLANKYSQQTGIPIFKFEFAGWFSGLMISDEDPKTHYFALGKEAMLLQLNRDKFLPNFILDRGFLTVLTWGIISKRISNQEALNQLNLLRDKGLLTNMKIVLVEGTNPESRTKDFWDFRESSSEEKETLSKIISAVQLIQPNLEIVKLTNDFTHKSTSKLIHLI
jgi:molybdopterin/thiamine biosynthesis adenylyltransferase